MRKTLLKLIGPLFLGGSLFLSGCRELEESVIVTIQVNDESYRVWVIDPVAIRMIPQILDGKIFAHPHGRLVKSPSKVNAPYAWHIDPRSAAFAEMSIELCDGKPSAVFGETWSGDYFCPWSGIISDIEKYPFKKTFVNTAEAKEEYKKIILEGESS